ncbi:MAG: hypothetical protein JXB19_05775 [Bacteroidales bacterium]|nr:hypothetical protein [Bacteroidales bacterium]
MKPFVIVLFCMLPFALYAQEETGCTWGNCIEGKGKYVYSNGYTYEGTFVKGLREGRGMLTAPDGGWYDGVWENDDFNGQGTYEWQDGTKYIGAWKDGLQNGYGIYFFPNGDKYTGYFKENKFNGEGKYTWADGTVQSGMYKDGELINDP